MCEKLSALELLMAAAHLLPEPFIVIEIEFDKLLNVVVRSTTALCRNAVKFRLQLRAKVHFHSLSVGKLNLPGKFCPVLSSSLDSIQPAPLLI